MYLPSSYNRGTMLFTTVSLKGTKRISSPTQGHPESDQWYCKHALLSHEMIILLLAVRFYEMMGEYSSSSYFTLMSNDILLYGDVWQQ